MTTEAELLDAELVAAVQAHAAEQYPRECCGVVLEGQGYVQMANLAADPMTSVLMDAEEMAAHHASGLLRSLVHSHPNGPDCPSAADMRSQAEHEVPFIIVSTNGEACLYPFAWGDQLEPAPLVGRGFRHGVHDCYSCCRDYYRVEQGVIIPDFPRDWEWWNKDENLYMNGFAEAGFHAIDETEAMPGDAVMMRIRSPVPNHAGIICEPGLLLHHVTATLAWDPSRLSRREPLGRWRQFVTNYFRHEAVNAS